MKKLQRFGVFMLCGALALSFVACGPEGGGGVTSDSTPIEQVDDSDRSGWVPFAKKTFEEGTELRIKYFKGGYGDEWLKAMEEKFEKDYPGVDVILIPSSNETDFTQTISTTLNTSPDDIYICHNIPYERLSVKNLVMNLDSLYNSVIYTDTKNTETTDDDTPVRFVDRIAASSLNMVRFNGHYVAIPEIQGAGGIAYNKTLFDANGWEIPETYEELVALAKTISEGNFKNADGEKVYPFVWSGTTAYMWDSFVYDMWVQIAGIDEFNTFMKYESKDLFDSSKYPALKQAWTYWYDLVCVNQEYSHPVFINESYARILNIDASKIGHNLREFDTFSDSLSILAGIIENFPFNSLEEEIAGQKISFAPESSLTRAGMFIQARLHPETRHETLAQIKELWEKMYDGREFQYTDMHQQFMQRNKIITTLSKILISYSLIAMVLTCFGLFGISWYAVRHRTREIAIRKVHGALNRQIVWALNRSFLWQEEQKKKRKRNLY